MTIFFKWFRRMC